MSTHSAPWTSSKEFLLVFDMRGGIAGQLHGGVDIPKNMKRLIHFSQSKWYVSEDDGTYHLYDGFNNCDSGDTRNKKISIFGLCLKFYDHDGSLVLMNDDYDQSEVYFPELPIHYKGMALGKLEWPTKELFQQGTEDSLGYRPCNVDWSNAYRIDPSNTEGMCLHFTAACKGSIFVVFSVIPDDVDSWYYVQITPTGVGMYKSRRLQVSTVNKNALGLGNAALFQSYFVCVKETPTSTVIEYGKSAGMTDTGDVYLAMIDTTQPLQVRFYAFGNGEEDLQVMDAHPLKRSLTLTECKGSTFLDKDLQQCLQQCHPTCDPLDGCRRKAGAAPAANECRRCRKAKNTQTNMCVDECPSGKKPNKLRNCVDAFQIGFKEGGYSSSAGLIHGVNFVHDFTICMWMKLSFANLVTGVAHRVFEFWQENGDNYVMAMFLEKGTTTGTMQILFEVQTDDVTYEVPAAESNRWFMFCVGRESADGRVVGYINSNKQGEEEFGQLRTHRLVMTGPWELYLEAPRDQRQENLIPGLLYSDWNIWDRVLTPEEVRPLIDTCGAQGGNVKDWYEIKEDLNAQYFNFAPSTCRT